MKKSLLILFLLCFGLSVKAQRSCPDNNHPHMIDLGLPSGTLWACCNVGATNPEEYGGYYAWGETEEKDYYDWDTYKWCLGDHDTLTKYCTDSKFGTVDSKETLSFSDDVARVKWGGNWRIPTRAEKEELCTNCEWIRITKNGVNGRKVVGPNGNSIFLPAAGYRFKEELIDAGDRGYYWLNSIIKMEPDYASILVSSLLFYKPFCERRCVGYSVRPVSPQSMKTTRSTTSSASSSPSTTNNPSTSSTTTSYSLSKQTFTVNGVSFTMVRVEGGTFTMGATEEQVSHLWDKEKPAHQVTLSTFSIGETEVSQELWEAVMESTPSYFKGPEHPMECVSWDDCQDFIQQLNAATGKSFRLPTEAEWEYAARGGNRSRGYKYAGSNNLDEVGWYWENSGDSRQSGEWSSDKLTSNHCQTHPVAQKQSNELGLYDMSGNVWEWCSDWYDFNYHSSSSQTNPKGPTSGYFRVSRGGSCDSPANRCYSSSRAGGGSGLRRGHLGLRLALSE